MIALHNDTDEERVIAGKERIAQMVVMPYLSVEFEEVETLNETERGKADLVLPEESNIRKMPE